jgi:hypothetical protein
MTSNWPTGSGDVCYLALGAGIERPAAAMPCIQELAR